MLLSEAEPTCPEVTRGFEDDCEPLRLSYCVKHRQLVQPAPVLQLPLVEARLMPCVCVCVCKPVVE